MRAVRALAAAVVGHGQTAAAAGHAGRLDGRAPAAPPAYNALEREPEVLAEQRVDHRVDGAVAVAQPEHDGEQCGLYARGAERAHQVHGEERQPAHDEAPHDDAQRLGRLGLHPEPLHLGLDVPLAAAHHLGRELGLAVHRRHRRRRPAADAARRTARADGRVATAVRVPGGRLVVRRRRRQLVLARGRHDGTGSGPAAEQVVLVLVVVMVLALRRRGEQQTRVRRGRVARAAPPVFLPAAAAAGHAQLARRRVGHGAHRGPLVLVRLGRGVVDGVQRARAGRRRGGRERAARLLAERLGRRVTVRVRRRRRCSSSSSSSSSGDRGSRVRRCGRGRAYAVRARVADADLDPLVVAAPHRRPPAARLPVRVRRRRSVDGRGHGGRGLLERRAAAAVYAQREPLLVEPVAERAAAAHRSEALVDGARRVHGRLVDAPVEEQHDEHRYVERAERRVHHVPLVVGQLAYPRARRQRLVLRPARLVPVQLVPDQHGGRLRRDVRVPPADQRWQAYHEAQHPHDHHQHLGAETGHQARVLHRSRHRQVPVQRYGAQVQDAGRAHPHVHGQPHGAQVIAEQPHLHNTKRLPNIIVMMHKYSYIDIEFNLTGVIKIFSCYSPVSHKSSQCVFK